MSKFKKILIYEAVVLVLLFLTFCNEQKKDENTSEEVTEYTLGNAYLEVSSNEEAKPYFEKGLLLLHSFEYWDAAEEFQKAQEMDPNFAMAYWGEAMTYNHSLWRGQQYEKAVETLGRLGETPEERASKAKTQLEKDMLHAVEILFGEGTKFERDQQYSNYLGELHEKYPDNQEIAAFYALSILGSVKEGRDEETYERGAIVAKGILEENPTHPGALHYLIHSYDDPFHAFKALEAADSYSEVAESAGHALHMPSHIYLALGMWDKVVSSNEASYGAAVARMERKGLGNNARGYHYFHWLMYGYLQQGRFAEAREMVIDMQKYSADPPSTNARSYMINMMGNYLTETGDWKDEEVRNHEVDLESINIRTRAAYSFIKGMGNYVNNDPAALEATINEILEDRKLAMGRMENRAIEGCGGSWRYEYPNQQDIDIAEVIQIQLQAKLSILKGDPEATENYLKKAADLEKSLSYTFGPPDIMKPSHELYGEWLMEQERFDEAIPLFEIALERGPKRVLSLKGIKKAYEFTGQDDKANEIQAELDEIIKVTSV